ncbi:protein-tyrosine phosphatase family protein [Bacillus sp. DJP31]|uniref:protein-tyrosine phosphatase family protein n=1 Tax=Bacillus sp. DJP31 TaxID=3409789 RepID=UPI003BB5E921
MVKNYHELIKGRIFIGGADDIDALLSNERIDTVYDLRAEATPGEYSYNRVHLPIVDDADQQDDSVKQAINEVINQYNDGKNVYFHCSGGKNRTGTVAIGSLLELGIANSVDEAENQAIAIRPVIKVKPEMKQTLGRLFPKQI